MFDSLRSTLFEQIETNIKCLAVAHMVRQQLDMSDTTVGAKSSFEFNLSNEAPARLPWLIHEHCASLTRLYSVLEIFLSSFTRDVCLTLEETNPQFLTLPERLRTAYRKGIARILSELEEKPYHRHINLAVFSRAATRGLSGDTPYKLLAEPFLASKRAFRLPQILDHLANLGFIEVEQSLMKHPSIRGLVANRERDVTEKEAYKGLLDRFIDARNDAAHTDVTAIWKLQDMRNATYLIRDLCLAIMDFAEKSLIQKLYASQKLSEIGIITETHSSRKGAVLTPVPCTLVVGGEVILVREGRVFSSVIQSIMVNDQSVSSVQSDGATEVGLMLGVNCNVGEKVLVIADVSSIFTPMLADYESDEEDDQEPEEDGNLQDPFTE